MCICICKVCVINVLVRHLGRAITPKGLHINHSPVHALPQCDISVPSPQPPLSPIQTTYFHKKKATPASGLKKSASDGKGEGWMWNWSHFV